jgi:hypothetical protein
VALEQLKHISRYLKAIQLRLDRLDHDPQKDAKKAVQNRISVDARKIARLIVCSRIENSLFCLSVAVAEGFMCVICRDAMLRVSMLRKSFSRLCFSSYF